MSASDIKHIFLGSLTFVSRPLAHSPFVALLAQAHLRAVACVSIDVEEASVDVEEASVDVEEASVGAEDAAVNDIKLLLGIFFSWQWRLPTSKGCT